MKQKIAATLLLTCLAAAALVLGSTPGPAKAVRAPGEFFGIAPQNLLTDEDAERMKAGGLDIVRMSLPWALIQPTRRSGYEWGSFDQQLSVAARNGLAVLPSIGSPPRWVIGNAKRLPVASARQRTALAAFLRAAVDRYGPGGEFWREQGGVGVNYEPDIPRPIPIRHWQIWNEVNFFYFIYPVQPASYAKMIDVAGKAIKQADPRAKVVLSGLFGEPTAGGKRGMPAATYLDRLYDFPGIKARFDGIALHPYAVDADDLERMVEQFTDVARENRDRPGLYITEMGWGSENNFRQVAFEQGKKGQQRQLRDSYRYLLANRRRLNLKQVHWFTWRDARGACTFCDSTGFFYEKGNWRFKPAWRTFVSITGGRVRP